MFQPVVLFKEGGLEGINEGPDYDNRRLVIRKNGVTALIIKISGTAVVVRDSGVNEENVYEWLWNQGQRYIESNPDVKFAKLAITTYDVKNGELTVGWSSLEKEVVR
ncbi:hypothetical protein [Cytobacillus pseudoceanisediminis]|uniref:hypothetical protein n=1 Tax=Cytobacillus pseudoceanisediminis TaxID=3051614 RepID=UPI003CF7B34D